MEVKFVDLTTRYGIYIFFIDPFNYLHGNHMFPEKIDLLYCIFYVKAPNQPIMQHSSEIITAEERRTLVNNGEITIVQGIASKQAMYYIVKKCVEHENELPRLELYAHEIGMSVQRAIGYNSGMPDEDAKWYYIRAVRELWKDGLIEAVIPNPDRTDMTMRPTQRGFEWFDMTFPGERMVFIENREAYERWREEGWTDKI